MKIMHHIAANWTEEEAKMMKKFGFDVPITKDLQTMQIEENEAYFKLKPYFEKWHVVNLAYTEFTNEELDNAKVLAFTGSWEHGYPQPEKDFGYTKKTYDSSNYCKECGTGLKQKEPFQMKAEPKWGKHKLLDLYWIGDELFVEKEFYKKIFEPLAVKSKPVIIHKTNEEAETVVQLDIPTIEEKLSLDHLNLDECKNCKTKKYSPEIRGFFPEYSEEIPHDIFKGQEYFGSGGMAFKRIFISQKLRQILLREKVVKATQFIPLRNKTGNPNKTHGDKKKSSWWPF